MIRTVTTPSPRRITGFAAAPFSLALLTLVGCASIDVEMDVYKGPFSNSADIEAEQFAVMAGAAKPLLESLRADLVHNALHRQPDRYIGSKDPNLDLSNIYCTNYFSSTCDYHPMAVRVSQDVSHPAYFVTEILDLYEPATLGHKLRELEALAQARQKQIDASNFATAYSLLDDINNILIDLLGDIAGRPQSDDTINAVRSLAALLSKTLDLGDLAVVWRIATCGEHAKTPTEFEQATVKLFSRSLQAEGGQRAIDAFSCTLSTTQKNIRTITDYSDRDSLKKAYADNIAAFEQLTIDNPKLVADTLRIIRAVDVVAIVESLNTPSQSVDLVTAGTKANDRKNMAKQLVGLYVTDPDTKAFVAAFRAVSKTSESDSEQVRFTGETATIDIYNGLSEEQKKDFSLQEAAFVDAVTRFLTAGRRTIGDLNKTESSNRENSSINDNKIVGYYTEYGNQFTTTAFQEEQINEMRNVSVSLSSLESQLSAFGRTRLPDGIDALALDFITKSSNCLRRTEAACRDETDDAREKLTFALVRFAQKVTYLADNDVLVNGAHGEPGGIDQTSRQYIQLLQSIGNTILVLADDTRRQDAHNDTTSVQREVDALTRSLSNTTERLYRDLQDIAASDDPEAVERSWEETKRAWIAIPEVQDALGDNFDAKDAETQTTITERFSTIWQGQVEAAKLLRDRGNFIRTRVFAGTLPPDDSDESLKVFLNDVLLPMSDLVSSDIKQTIAAYHERAFTGSDTGSREDLWNAYRASVNTNLDAIQKAFEAWQSLEALKAREERADQLAFVAGFLREWSPGVAAQQTGSTNPDDLFPWLYRELAKTNLDDTQQASIRTFLESQRSGRTYISPDVSDIDPQSDASRTDVMDQYLAQLRYAHLQAITLNGPDSVQANRLKAAIDAAHDYRGGLTYIRPAGTYLRNSYAATEAFGTGSVSANPAIGWSNMLERSTFRTWVPFYAEGRTSQVARAIDQQYWQTINNVHVSGGGRTNFVVAKDDTGNFYVKNVGTSKEEIANSMKGLALFGLSDSFSRNLLDLDPNNPGSLRDGKPTSPTGKVFSGYQERYQEETKKQIISLMALFASDTDNSGTYESALLSSLSVTIRSALAEASEDPVSSTAQFLAAAREKAVGPDFNPENFTVSGTEAGQTIIDAVYTLREARNEMDAKLSGLSLAENEQGSDTPTEEQRRYDLRQAAWGIFSSHIDGVLDRRPEHIRTYSNGASVLIEVISEETSTETPQD